VITYVSLSAKQLQRCGFYKRFRRSRHRFLHTSQGLHITSEISGPGRLLCFIAPLKFNSRGIDATIVRFEPAWGKRQGEMFYVPSPDHCGYSGKHIFQWDQWHRVHLRGGLQRVDTISKRVYLISLDQTTIHYISRLPARPGTSWLRGIQNENKAVHEEQELGLKGSSGSNNEGGQGQREEQRKRVQDNKRGR
jgi:hypothetical protein